MPDPSPYATQADRSERGWDQPRHSLAEAQAVGAMDWSHAVRGLAADTEFLLLAGALLALSGWFFLESSREFPHSAPAAPVLSMGPVPAVRSKPAAFSFIAAEGRDRLLPAMTANGGRSMPALAKSETTAGIEHHALLAGSMLDPLGSVQISGLPADTRLSAGAAFTKTVAMAGGTSGDDDAASSWAVAFGDLDNLVIELPQQQIEPFRATLDLRNRAGVKITSLTVEVRPTDPGTAITPPLATSKSKVRPATSVQRGSKNLRKPARTTTAAPATKPTASYPGDAPKALKPQKSVGAPANGPAPPVNGLFQPDPKDSALSGLSPALREDPRFMTLRGLGMAPSDFSPATGATAP